MMDFEWVDREALERRKLGLHPEKSAHGRRSGPCRVVLSSRPEPSGLGVKLRAMSDRLCASQIDKDFVRGGFSRYMRHAR